MYGYSSPHGEQFMKAMKLRNGDYAYIAQLGNAFVHDAGGQGDR